MKKKKTLKNEILTRFENWNCDKTQTQIVTELKSQFLTNTQEIVLVGKTSHPNRNLLPPFAIIQCFWSCIRKRSAANGAMLSSLFILYNVVSANPRSGTGPFRVAGWALLKNIFLSKVAKYLCLGFIVF